MNVRKRGLALLMCICMVFTLLPFSAFADETTLAAGPSGSIESAGITHAGGYLKNAVSVELKDVTFAKSVAVELYSGDTLLTTATLKTGVLPVGKNNPYVTCCIPTEGEDDAWSLTDWTPKDDVVPDKAVLVVDGSKLYEKTFTLNADEWAALPGTVSGSINGAIINQNAVSVELQNVTFAKSVAVELYSGGTLLTTATLNTDKLGAGSYPYLTCCIATQTADEYWSLTPWTPKDDVVPNKAVLVVDGSKLDEKTLTLNADEWAALPGTVSGSINGAIITQNAVSVELENVNFESSVQVQLYSGDTLLTTATLKPGILDAGSYPYVTCCIPTEGEDDAWSLTDWTPKDNVVPNKAVLVVDGSKLDEKTLTLNADEWAALPGTVSGSINGAIITQNAVSVELENVNFESSVQVQLYSGDTLLTTATLKPGILDAGSYPYVTCCIPTEGEDDAWSLTDWTPKDNVVPNKAVLVVDGSKLDEKTLTLNADEWAALPGTVSGSINGAIITQNAVSVELENVNFESSVQVQLYSGDTLLTTATLKPGILDAGSYPYVTCCIPTEGEDDAWSLTDWTPKDNVVPNKAVLVVDGSKLDEKTLTLNADEWAALPGTVSGSINGAIITQNAVSVELENVNFESSVQVQLYSGDTLLTTATLKPGILDAGSYPYVTCCIPTEGEDDAWSLTDWTPKDNVVPNKAVLVVDGSKLDEKTLTLNANEWAALPGTVSGSIERVGITHDNGVLKNAVSVDLKNVNFESSVQVQLYSGDTLLTTATLQGVAPSNYGFLTCCIATETADENWALTPWTPKDNVVPNKTVLVVDGHELDTKTFTLNADEWAALPGTVSGSGGSSYSYYSVKVSAESGGAASASLATAAAGTEITLTATPDTGYHFKEWQVVSGNVTIKDNKFTMPAGNVEVKAIFEKNTTPPPAPTYYSITVTKDGSGTASASLATAAAGTEITLTAKAGAGYTFKEWQVVTGGVTITDNKFTMPAGNVEVKAIFEKNATPTPTVNPFVDVKAGSFYYDAVLWAVEKGVTTGTSATTFEPDGSCTRAQAVTFLWRVAGCPAPKSAAMPFTDVKAGSFYYDAVLWAVENGITKGTSETTFEPEGICTRAQIVTLIWRAQKSPAAGTDNPFNDVKAGSFYETAVLWAVKAGVTKGTSAVTFEPEGICTRGQVVTFLYRAQ